MLKRLVVPEHVVSLWGFISQPCRALVTAISTGLTDSASHDQADVKGGNQVLADLQWCTCKYR